MAVTLSILDLAPVHRHETVADALAGSVHLAQRAVALGYRRVWYAEHRNMPRIASAATSVLIAHVAAQTATIRLGAGGIMLPNHAPLTIAEQFGTLATLHPGRIELGLGRAPGTDQATMRALRRSPASAQSFPDDVRELQGYLGDVSTIPGIQAIPGAGTHVPLTILGSSLYGAQLAAAFGLPYAFASHFAPAALADAVTIYRDRFEPSDQLDAPHVTVAVNVITAGDDATAQQLLRGTARQRVRLLFSRPGQKLTEEQADLVLDDPAGRGAWDMLGCRAVGTPERVVEQLDELADATAADELILASCAPDRSAAVTTVESIARQRLASVG